MLLKLSNFIPSKEYLEWLKSCTCVQQLHHTIFSNWVFTNDKDILNPEEAFNKQQGNITSYHWFLAYSLWRRFDSKVYLVEVYRFTWRFPFIETYTAVIRKDKDGGYTLFDDGDTYFVTTAKEILTALKYFRIKNLFRIPTNKKLSYKEVL